MMSEAPSPPVPAAPPPVPPDASPIEASGRLTALDATRGLALLGIFLVNIQAFAEPFGRFVVPVPTEPDTLSRVLYYFVDIFCEGKFYPLFSMLFGIGLVLQMSSIARSRRSFVPLYLRRLLVLMLIGLAHALLFWYGDILFVYAFAGLVLLLCSKARGKTLLWVGIGLLAGTTLVGGALSGLAMLSPPPPEVALVPEPSIPPLSQLFEAMRSGKLPGGPETPFWMELETRAYRDGPWLQSFGFRAMTWAFYIIFCFIGFGWHVVAMFMIGAGIAKLGLFTPEGRGWRRRLMVVGLLIGLPGAFAASLLPLAGVTIPVMILSAMLLFACGPLVSLLYLCGMFEVVERGPALLRSVAAVLASVGRMALTNYLLQTLIATFVFYHWGLAQFAQWTRPERVALVLGVFAVQCVVSPLWLRAFRFGPMEWVWRSLTYLRPQPMRAEPSSVRGM